MKSGPGVVTSLLVTSAIALTLATEAFTNNFQPTPAKAQTTEELLQITNCVTGHNLWPQLSWDGKHILYTSDCYLPNSNIWNGILYDIETGKSKLVLENIHFVSRPYVGSGYIAYVENYQQFLYNIETGQKTQITEDYGTGITYANWVGSMSLDGTRYYYSRQAPYGPNNYPVAQLFEYNLQTGDTIPITNGPQNTYLQGSYVSASQTNNVNGSDGYVVFNSMDDLTGEGANGKYKIFKYSPATGKIEHIKTTPNESANIVSISPDGNISYVISTEYFDYVYFGQVEASDNSNHAMVAKTEDYVLNKSVANDGILVLETGENITKHPADQNPNTTGYYTTDIYEFVAETGNLTNVTVSPHPSHSSRNGILSEEGDLTFFSNYASPLTGNKPNSGTKYEVFYLRKQKIHTPTPAPTITTPPTIAPSLTPTPQTIYLPNARKGS